MAYDGGGREYELTDRTGTNPPRYDADKPARALVEPPAEPEPARGTDELSV